MEWIYVILALLGGISLFLYGMKMMSEGLQRTAGNRLRRWLEALTKNRIMAVAAGTAVTVVIQSSTATTVMVVGFINSGLMQLSQAVGVIMGANIGTTFTGILITFKISVIAPIAAFIGVVILMISKNKKTKDIGGIIAGIGILFIGMNMMSDAMKPLSSSEEFMGLLQQAKNPFIGLIAGAVLTAVLQSSTAMTGVLIALATAGVLDLQTGIFILFGTNVGTCITAMLASIGATKMAKRAAVVHLLFNVIGAVIFSVIVLLPIGFINMIEQFIPSNSAMQLAGMHIIFSVVTTILLLPFIKQLIWLATRIVRGEDKPREELRLLYVEPKSFITPAIAATQVRKEVSRMAQIALKNYRLSIQAFLDKRTDLIDDVLVNEEVINFLDHEISRYLVKISVMDLDDNDREMINSLYQVVNSIERVGDYAENIVEFAQTSIDKDRVFSDEAICEITTMANTVSEALTSAVDVFLTGTYDQEILENIQKAERDMYAEVMQYKGNHLERSKENISERKVGLIFTNMLDDLRKIVRHSSSMVRSLSYQKE